MAAPLRLCLLLLLPLLCPSWAKEQKCLTSASNCDECIQSGPECAWCTAPHSKLRCHTLKGLRRAGCLKSDMYNPQGGLQVVKDEPRDLSITELANDEALFLQPQELSLRLRPGVSQSFTLTIAIPTGQPITKLNMDTSPVPAGVNITFSSITQGNPMVVQVNVEAAQCPGKSDDPDQMQNRTGPWSVDITPEGFSLSVKLEITLECQCDCRSNREENSVGCSGHGALVCGHCQCYQPYVGNQCHINTPILPNEDYCRKDADAPVCSGRGKCVEDLCECEKRGNPAEKYSGQFCECSNFDCPYHNNRLCGGHGSCQCGHCICDDEWTGGDCACSMETASCMATNQNICNYKGMCRCGTCECEPPFEGPTCEECPTCQGSCQRHAECVECRAFGIGAKKDRCDHECGYIAMTMVDDLPEARGTMRMCRMRSQVSSCFFYYTFSSTPSGGQATVVRARECPPVL